MVKNNGCLCWPSIAAQKRNDRSVDSIPDSFQKTSSAVVAGPSTTTEVPPLPREHDEFLEMIFPTTVGLRRRSRTLSLSIQAPHKNRLFQETQKFRERTNSVTAAGKRNEFHEDLSLLRMVPLTPDAYHKGFSATLPLGFRGQVEAESRGTSDEWPAYLWRLQQKKQQRCSCSGCEDICSSSYKYPVQHKVGPFFDNESYYNSQVMLNQSGRERRKAGITFNYDRPPPPKETVRTKSYDVPNKRVSLPCSQPFSKEENITFDLNCSYNRPISSWDFRTEARRPSCSKAAPSTGTLEYVVRRPKMNECPFDLYDRRTSSLDFSVSPKPPGGCSTKGPHSNARCLAYELKSDGMDKDWLQRNASASRPFDSHSRRYCDEGSYVESDKKCTNFEGVVSKGKTTNDMIHDYPDLTSAFNVRCREADNTGVLSSVTPKARTTCAVEERCLKVFYAACSNNNSDEEIQIVNETLEVPVNEEIKESESLLLETSQSQAKPNEESEANFGLQAEEDESLSEDTQRSDDQSSDVNENFTKYVTPSPINVKIRHKSEATSVKAKCGLNIEEELPTSNQIKSPEDAESQQQQPREDCDGKTQGKLMNVDEDSSFDESMNEDNRREINMTTQTNSPSSGRRSLSQADLLLLSPPPQCCFMVDHSYVNITNAGPKKKPNFVEPNQFDDEDACLENRDYTSDHVFAYVDDLESLMAVTKQKMPFVKYSTLQHEKQQKMSYLPYVKLYKKVSGNNYYKTRLPTLNEHVRNICRAN